MRLFISDFNKSFFTVKTLICIVAIVVVSLLCYNQDLLYVFFSNDEKTLLLLN